MSDPRVFMAFPPFYTETSRLLILGSFPSVLSRKQKLASLAGEAAPQSVPDKKDFLARHDIALWDVVKECKIKGSLDADITDYTIQNIPELLNNAPDIELIALNGGTAFRFFKRAFPQYGNVVALPSTSPANTRFDYAVWKQNIGRFFKR